MESDIGAAGIIESRLTCTLMELKYLIHHDVDRTSQTSVAACVNQAVGKACVEIYVNAVLQVWFYLLDEMP